MARRPPDRARRRLRLGLGVFFLALALPSGALVYRAYDQLKWESFRRQQLAAEDLAQRIDRRLAELARAEDARAASDYGFLTEGPGLAGARRSPLGDYPVRAEIPGLLGWFQVAEDGRFSSPLVPEVSDSPGAFGVGPAELASRQALAARIEGVLIGNRLVERVPVESGDDGGRVAAAAAAPSETSRGALASGESRDRLAESETVASLATHSAPAPKARLSQQAFEQLSAQRPAPAASRERAKLAKRDEAPHPATARPRSKAENESDRPVQSVQGLGRVDELALDAELAQRLAPELADAQSKRESGAAPPAEATAGAASAAQPALALAPMPLDKPQSEVQNAVPLGPPAKPRSKLGTGANMAPSRPKDSATGAKVGLFGNAVEPFELGLLGSGHFVLFRAVHRNGERLVQGLLIEQGPFLAALMESPFRLAPLAATTDLIVAFRDEVLAAFRARAARGYVTSARELTGALLYRTRLREPFGALELIFSVGRLPVPPGGTAIASVAGLLALVLIGGTWLMYRLGLRQLALVRQQQSFVSAVSHELKTPLTSIRMYAEMLRAGFADEDRRQVYYRYIQEESERLSRLIANVLALSRIGRDALAVAPQDLDLAEVMAQVRERVSAPAERAGFRLDIDCTGAGEGARVLADPDAILQILINLVDNALKFAAQCEPKLVEIRCDRPRDGWVRIRVRDYGPGVPRELRRRVFELFYRGADAGARAIPGTGIGLALVERLTRAMGGRVELIGREPGVEARVELPSGSG